MMDPMNAAQQMLSDKQQKRPPFSPMRAIRSLSIGSQKSHLSIDSDADSSDARARRRTFGNSGASGVLKKGGLIRKDSKSSTEGSVGRDSTSTQPTTPSIISRSTSIYGDVGSVIKSGALQPEPSILKPKKEYLVLTQSVLFKFRSRAAAEHQFPVISLPDQALGPLSPIVSCTPLKDPASNAEASVPLEKIISVFKGDGTRPSFSIEIWWKSSNAAHAFASAEFDFSFPGERDDWLKQIRFAVRGRVKTVGEERVPPEIELGFGFTPTLEIDQTSVDIYPVVPRRSSAKPVGQLKKNGREASSFYLAFSKYSLYMAQFSASSKPNIVQFGLVTLSRVRVNVNDERFDLLFRLPLEQPQKLQLSSQHYRTILSKLFQIDTYLKPAWPLWTRQEVFHISDDAQRTPLPNGEDYGGFRTTLEAFIEGYRCRPIEWTVRWKDVQHAPQFCLLQPRGQPHYSAHQLLAVFRALRFNEFFKSISFRDIDFSSLSKKFDNTGRLEPIIWLSRTGKHSLTRSEADMVESSSVLCQELVAVLLGSESIRHIDLTNVLRHVPAISSPQPGNSPSALTGVCEIIPPIVLLWKSIQTRCNSINLNGNAIGEIDAIELSRVFQERPNFLRAFNISRCNLDEASLVYLWEGLHEQRSSLEELDTSYNPGRIEASRATCTLNEANRLRRLNLAYTIRGQLEGSLFRPWSAAAAFKPWRLVDLDLSGWKLNFETFCAIMKYLELDESNGLRRLSLNGCALNGELATGLFCRIGASRDIQLFLNSNPLEAGSTDWIDLIHGNEAPAKLHLDMIEFQHESNFNKLLTALSYNKTIKFLSMAGTGPPGSVTSKTCERLSNLFKTNNTLKFLDLSGYSGKIEDGQLGWGLSGALGGLKDNTSLRQLRLRNHGLGAAKDLSELCRVLVANKGLTMFDIRHNNFDHNQFAMLVQALARNHRLISFPISDADREYILNQGKRHFLNQHRRPTAKVQDKLTRSAENRLDDMLARLRGLWDSDAKKAKEVIWRNRNDPANQIPHSESEYLEAWADDELALWLALRPAPFDKAERRASEPNMMTLVGDMSPTSPTASNTPITGFRGPSSRRASCPPRKTYVIEEET